MNKFEQLDTEKVTVLKYIDSELDRSDIGSSYRVDLCRAYREIKVAGSIKQIDSIMEDYNL